MLKNFSNPIIVKQNAKDYLGNDVRLYLSTRKDKKYMVERPDGKNIHFGQMGYEDFTKHKDLKRREAYLKRATKIKGNWKSDKYSPNNLSIHILWRL
jgi:hypothetical protein